MRYLLSLTLVAIVALSAAGCVGPYWRGYTVAQESGGPHCMRLAQPGDTKIQIYCYRPSHAKAPTAATTCRKLAKAPNNEIRTYCGTDAEWNEYDTWAVTAGVTCRWNAFARKDGPNETCQPATQWAAQSLAAAARR